MIDINVLIRDFEKNGFKPLDVVCPDGAWAKVTPCPYCYGLDHYTVDDIEYWLVDCDLPWLGNDKLSRVVDDLNNHAQLVADADKEKDDLRKFFDDHQKNGWRDEDWDCYSDWHKDVYGYRPHGKVCGIYVNPWKP